MERILDRVTHAYISEALNNLDRVLLNGALTEEEERKVVEIVIDLEKIKDNH